MSQNKKDGPFQYIVTFTLLGSLILGAVYFFLGYNRYQEKNIQIDQKWYVGGTLHDATALEWQDATFENKLATCGDIIAVFRRDKKFKPDIQAEVESLDGVKALSEELVVELDAAFRKRPDPESNAKFYENQTVASWATIIVAVKGWLNN